MPGVLYFNAGVPAGTSPQGTFCLDTTNGDLYINTDGATNWELLTRPPTALSMAILSVAVDTTLDDTHFTVTVDASGAPRTITLPAVSGITGRMYHIKKTDSSANAVTVDGNGAETIDGATTFSLANQFDNVTIIAGASEWHIL